MRLEGLATAQLNAVRINSMHDVVLVHWLCNQELVGVTTGLNSESRRVLMCGDVEGVYKMVMY